MSVPAATTSKPSLPSALPNELVGALPVSREIMAHASAIAKLLPQLERELTAARKRGAIDLARSFTVLHRLMAVIDERFSRPLSRIFEQTKTVTLPQAFEEAGVSHVPLAAGYRVSVSYATRASTRDGMREAALEWMRANHPECVSETINSSTLSRLARELLQESGAELPERIFNVAQIPGASVTRVG